VGILGDFSIVLIYFIKRMTVCSHYFILPKSLEYIIKFIVVSWMNYVKTNPSGQEEQLQGFKNDLLAVLWHINGLMLKTEREFIGAQTVALKNFMSIFTDLEKIFNITERSKIAIDFINSVKYDESRKILNSEKLQLIQGIVESELFLNDGRYLSPSY
jgi:hypothetical protein